MSTIIYPFQLFTSMRYDPQLHNSTANRELNVNLNVSENGLYMLPYHRDRMLQAAEHFGWSDSQQALKNPEAFTILIKDTVIAYKSETATGKGAVHDEKTALRLKVILHENGSLEVQKGPTPAATLDGLFPQTLDLPQHRKEAKPLKISPLTGGGLQLGSQDFIPTSHDGTQPWPIYIDTHETTPSALTKYKTTERSMYDSARDRAGITNINVEEEVLLVNTSNEIMEGSMTTPYFRKDSRWITPPLSSGGQTATTRRWALERGLCVEGVMEAGELENGEDIWISSGVRGFRRGKIHRRPGDLGKQL